MKLDHFLDIVIREWSFSTHDLNVKQTVINVHSTSTTKSKATFCLKVEEQQNTSVSGLTTWYILRA